MSDPQIEFLENQNAQMQHQLEELGGYVKGVERLSNLRAWAVDRAVSIIQTNRSLSSTPTFDEVHDLAEQLALYAYGVEYQELVENAKKETVQ